MGKNFIIFLVLSLCILNAANFSALKYVIETNRNNDKVIRLSEKTGFLVKNYDLKEIYDNNGTNLKAIELRYPINSYTGKRRSDVKYVLIKEEDTIVLKEYSTENSKQERKKSIFFKKQLILAKSYYDNGNIRVISEYESKTGVFGTSTRMIKNISYYQDGSIESELVVKNKKFVKRINYFSNGKVEAVYPLDENGKNHGDVVLYREDGSIRIKGYFYHGEKLLGIRAKLYRFKEKFFD